MCTVAYLLNCGATETAVTSKRHVTAFASQQQLGKQVPAATHTHGNRGTVGNGVFYSVLAKGL
jgi:hypothetical protein